MSHHRLDDLETCSSNSFEEAHHAASIECIPPPPPPPAEFFECSTPKMNNCKRSTQRQLELLRMLDDDFYHCSPTISPSSFVESKSIDNSRSSRVSVAASLRRRPTPVSCPLDEDPIPTIEQNPSCSPDFDESQPPALPMRRNAICPSNMPASIMVQLVIGR